jgi:hypothetical protein
MYWKYLKYILIHKWYVMQECFKRRLFWRGLMHDMSKFRFDEFIPYARYFYGNYIYWDDMPGSMKYQGFTTKEEIDEAFDIAWLRHQHRNRHHWQHWVLREDSGNIKLMHMKYVYVEEMVCDWVGAGKAINGVDNTIEWYHNNKDKMMLEETTRRNVEFLLGI